MPAASSLSAVRPDDSLRRYLQHVRTIQPLTDEEEAELATRFAAGDADAGERLVIANLRTVIKVAFRYHAQLGMMSDLVQEGNVGLLRALDKYDPTKGIPFSAYARYWIRAMILRFLMENHRLVQVGRTRSSRRVFFQLAREQARLEQSGQPARLEALAERMDVAPTELDTLRQVLAPEESLDAPDPVRPWHEVLAGRGSTPEDEAAKQHLMDRLRRLLVVFGETLTCERERALLHEGLLADEPVSNAELGRRFGVSRERIRQLSNRLQQRIRLFLLEELGADVELAVAA